MMNTVDGIFSVACSDILFVNAALFLSKLKCFEKYAKLMKICSKEN